MTKGKNAAEELEHIGDIAVDSGQIEIGDCGEVQLTVPTVYGDGFYAVHIDHRAKKIIIDLLPVKLSAPNA